MQAHVLIRCLSAGLAAMALVLVASVSASDRVVAATALSSLDKQLMAALGEPAGKRALELFGAADQTLAEVHKGRQGTAGQGTDLDVTVRARLIDNMRDVVAFEMQGQLLESVRLQVRTLDLVRSLWEAANARQAEKTAELDALVSAVYDRLAATGARDRNAKVAFGLADGESLLFRIMVLQEGTKLSAFELAGNRGARRATWRETPLRPRGADLLAKAAALIGGASNVKVPFAAAAYPMLLVIGGAMGDADARTEAELAARLATLPEAGIVPVVVEGDNRTQPLLKVPAIAGTAEARAGFAGAGAVLFHRGSGALVHSFERMASLRDLDAAIAAARSLADEILGDVGRAAPAKSAAESDPAGAVASADLRALLPVPAPVAAAKGSARDLLAVSEPTSAADAANGKAVKLTPEDPLVLAATLPGTAWAQYAREGSDGSRLVWLRRDQVAAYVPPPAAAEEPAAAKAGGARSGAEGKSDKTTKPAAAAAGKKSEGSSWLGGLWGSSEQGKSDRGSASDAAKPAVKE